jgi:hypothetical protein
MNIATYEIDLDAPLVTPRKPPVYRTDEAIDHITHALTTIEDALKLGVQLGERRNTLNAFVAKLNRLLARHP